MTILTISLLTPTHSIFLVVLTEEVEPAAMTEAEAPAKEAKPRQPTRRRMLGRQPTWRRTSGRRSPEVPGAGRHGFLEIGGRRGGGGSSGRKELRAATEELWP
jgi:uncharacterized membrane protein YgcG